MPTMRSLPEEPYQYVWEATHRIYYNTPNPVPIREMIIALQGLEGILRSLPKAVTELTGVEIADAQFLVQSIETGSLLEDFAVKFFFKDKEGFDAFAEKMGQNKMIKGAAIAAIIAGLVGYGIAKVTSSSAAPNITATNSVIIQGGAGALNITPEAFEAALRVAAADKKSTAESALKLMAPARAQPGSSVVISKVDEPDQDFTFSPQAVAEVPARIELETNERTEEYKNTRLVIRATNLDSKKSGWAGKLALREERLPIELDPSVSESEIFGRQELMVDAALVFKEKGRSRELKPARIYVRRVIGPVTSKK